MEPFPPIDLAKFSWEALATLVTGLAAVTGAVGIGLRQAGIANRQSAISDKQTDILARQADIEHMKLQAELYAHREKIFDSTIMFMHRALSHEDINEELDGDFRSAVAKSMFFFPPELTERMKHISHLVDELIAANNRVKFSASSPQADYQLAKTERMAAWSALHIEWCRIEATFGEMGLYRPVGDTK
jgi:hypothetical protein